jgi:hypothetical protein
MTDNVDVSEMISKELAVVERDLAQLHQKVRALEAKRDRFRVPTDEEDYVIDMGCRGGAPEEISIPGPIGVSGSERAQR